MLSTCIWSISLHHSIFVCLSKSLSNANLCNRICSNCPIFIRRVYSGLYHHFCFFHSFHRITFLSRSNLFSAELTDCCGLGYAFDLIFNSMTVLRADLLSCIIHYIQCTLLKKKRFCFVSWHCHCVQHHVMKARTSMPNLDHSHSLF